MVELVDALDLGSSAARRESSSLSTRTTLFIYQDYIKTMSLEIEKKLIKNEKLSKEFDIVIPKNIIEHKIDSELLNLQKTYKVDGFRPGKVPVEVIRKREEGTFFMKCAELCLNELIDDLVKEEQSRLASQPKVDLKKFEPEADVEFNLILEFMPKVPDLELNEIKLNKYLIEAEEKDIDEATEKLLKNFKKFDEKSSDSEAKLGDAVKINFLGKVDGVPFSGGEAKDYQLDLGSHSFIDTFEDQLVGKKAGDKVVVKVKFPENYQQYTLAGKDAEFDVEVLSVSSISQQDLTDEFVKTNFNVDNIEKLREILKSELNKNYENYSKSFLKKNLFDYIGSNLQLDLPETLVEDQFKLLWKREEEKISSRPELEKEKDSLKDKIREEAKKSLKIGLFLSSMAEKNKIYLSDSEITKAITEKALSMPGYEKVFMDFYKKNQQALDELKGSILEDKIIDFILEKISLNEIKTTIREFEELSNK